MSGLADYLDLLEPRIALPAPGVPARRPTRYAPPGFGAPAPSSVSRATVSLPADYRSVLPSTFRVGAPTGTASSSDPAAAARASCAAFCADPANARECVPASSGGTGACSPWVAAPSIIIGPAPGGTAPDAGPAPGGTAPDAGPAPGGTAPDAGPAPGGGATPPPAVSAKPVLWPWAVAAIVAWRLLRG